MALQLFSALITLSAVFLPVLTRLQGGGALKCRQILRAGFLSLPLVAAGILTGNFATWYFDQENRLPLGFWFAITFVAIFVLTDAMLDHGSILLNRRRPAQESSVRYVGKCAWMYATSLILLWVLALLCSPSLLHLVVRTAFVSVPCILLTGVACKWIASKVLRHFINAERQVAAEHVRETLEAMRAVSMSPSEPDMLLRCSSEELVIYLREIELVSAIASRFRFYSKERTIGWLSAISLPEAELIKTIRKVRADWLRNERLLESAIRVLIGDKTHLARHVRQLRNTSWAPYIEDLMHRRDELLNKKPSPDG